MKDSTDMSHSDQAQEITSLIQCDLLIFCAAAIPEYKGVQDEAIFPGMDSVYSINEKHWGIHLIPKGLYQSTPE